MKSPELPKQFLKVGNEPILVKTVRNFTDFGSFRAGVICCPVDWIEYTKAMLLEYGFSQNEIYVIPGGKNRNSSVQNGCKFLIDKYNVTDDDIVLTHDAVRPFINSTIIKDNISATKEFGAANTVMPVYDSVIRTSTGDFLTEHLPRKELYRVQTPQTFHLKELENVKKEDRTAHFSCAVVCLFPDGRKISVTGTSEGYIDFAPHGNGGFGYDPIFISEKGCFAELSDEQKDSVSHRGRALRKFEEKIKEMINGEKI